MCELPVGGGAGIEDVLFGREQRQTVGVEVDLPCVHDGKSFPDFCSFWLSSLIPTDSGGWLGGGSEKFC